MFLAFKTVIKPSSRFASYLKFKGHFKLQIDNEHSVFLLNDNSTVPSLLFWRGMKGYESASLEVWTRLSRESSVILDLGANFGLFGILSKAVNPKSEVIFFEPLMRNAQRIQNNLNINNFEGSVEVQAIGDADGKISFYDMDSDENTIGSIHKDFVLKHKHHSNLIEIEVPMIRLDTYIKAKGLDAVDLVKIDVEGADLEVLMGFSHYISNFKPKILIEITDSLSANRINQFLSALPFRFLIYEINDDEGLILIEEIRRTKNARNFLLTTEEVEL